MSSDEERFRCVTACLVRYLRLFSTVWVGCLLAGLRRVGWLADGRGKIQTCSDFFVFVAVVVVVLVGIVAEGGEGVL